MCNTEANMHKKKFIIYFFSKSTKNFILVIHSIILNF